MAFLPAIRNLAKMAAGPSRQIEPRKGAGEAKPYPSAPSLGATDKRRPDPPNFFVPVPALRSLADRDDIIFAIRRTLRMAIGELAWGIVPDLDPVKADIRRWQTTIMVKLALPDLELPFVPQAMLNNVYAAANPVLNDLLKNIYKESMTAGAADFQTFARVASRDPRLSELFDKILAAHEAIASSHIPQVEALFKKPNPSAESSFRSFLNLILDDVTLFDGAAIIKNPTLDGRSIGELYTLPGEEIRIYRSPDLSTPQPPYVAYDWSQNIKVKAYYNNCELVYVMANPQQNGYGKSPVSLIIEKMAGAIYANANMYAEMADRNIPFFVFDLGPSVSQPEKDAVEAAWDSKVAKGPYRGIFVGLKDGVKGFIPMPTPTDRTDSLLARLKYWANVKTAMYGLSLNDIGFTEDLHRTTADTQAELSQSRGINSLADIVEGYFNGEIVKGQMWIRDNPDDPNCMNGTSVECFPFKDVKFQFERTTEDERAQRAADLLPYLPTGAVCINDIRDMLNLPHIDGGDIYVFQASPASLIRVEALADLPAALPMQQPVDPNDPNAQQDPNAPGGGQQPQAGPAPGQAALPPGQSQEGANGDDEQNVAKSIASVERLASSLQKMLTKGD